MDLFIDVEVIFGFMYLDEGCVFYEVVFVVVCLGFVMEIGIYCGKFFVYIGFVCRCVGGVLFIVDYYCGFEEN